MFATGAQAQVECSGNGPYEVPSDWTLKPSGVDPGDNFRLLFVTSTTRNASATGIATYNTFVQTRAKAGHSAITDSCGNQFKVVGSTSAVDARDNTSTTGAGQAIYWLTGAKVADNYADFYDGSWDSYAGRQEQTTRFSSTLRAVIRTAQNLPCHWATMETLRMGDWDLAKIPLVLAVVLELQAGPSTPCPPSSR